jgi:putative transcriptional regulator
MSNAGKRLIKAALEAASIARGEKKPARVHLPDDVDVRDIGLKLELSQEEFAKAFGFTINQIRDWEQGRTRPLNASRAYLLVIKSDPRRVRRVLDRVSTGSGRRAA